MRRRIDVKPDNIEQFSSKSGVVGQLELAELMRLETMLAPDTLRLRQIRCTDRTLMPMWRAMATEVQCVVSPGAVVCVAATTRASTSAPSGGMRAGRVLSRSRPATPSARNRSCHRQTEVLLVPVRRVSSIVPQPSAVSSTICARQTCFCGLFRSVTIATRRWRSVSETSIAVRLRIRQTRTRNYPAESLIGCKRQIISTSDIL